MPGYEGLNAVVYARVSTDDKNQKPEHQIGEIRRFCDREGISIVKNGEFIEERSGKDLDRPGFQSLLGRITVGMMANDHDPKNGTCKVDLLIAWTQSRISRDTGDFINIKKQIEALGCRFLFVDNPTDTTSDESELLLTISAGMAQVERKRIAKNVAMGIRQAKLSGKWVTRPKRIAFMEDLDNLPKGAVRTDDKVKHRTVVVTEQEVYSCAKLGYSTNKTAKEFNVPSSTFYNELKITGRLEEYNRLMNLARERKQ